MPVLSVIVPIFNAEQYLHQCIDSILNQTLKDIEIILIDDGSTDNSSFICEEYATKYDCVKVIHQSNAGLFGARLVGVKFCETKYLTFVDADDFIERDAYIHALPSMENDVDIILFDIYNYSEDLKIKKRNSTIFPYGVYDGDAIRQIIFPRMIMDGDTSTGIHPHLVTKVFKRELIEKALDSYNRTSQYYGEDNITTYTALKYANRIEFINHAYYNYRSKPIGVIPPYIESDNFFDEVYHMYDYLRNFFSDTVVLKKQIDLFYLEAVNLRKKLYGISNSSSIRYMFPFDKVKTGKEIVLYGAGEVGKAYKSQIDMINYCKNVVWVDKNYKLYNRPEIVGTNNIRWSDFDYIVIAIANKHIAEDARNDLLNMGAPEKIIVMPS